MTNSYNASPSPLNELVSLQHFYHIEGTDPLWGPREDYCRGGIEIMHRGPFRYWIVSLKPLLIIISLSVVTNETRPRGRFKCGF